MLTWMIVGTVIVVTCAVFVLRRAQVDDKRRKKPKKPRAANRYGV